jgi:hypothetical protein
MHLIATTKGRPVLASPCQNACDELSVLREACRLKKCSGVSLIVTKRSTVYFTPLEVIRMGLRVHVFGLAIFVQVCILKKVSSLGESVHIMRCTSYVETASK